MAGQNKKKKNDNAIVKYFRETRAELKRVRWPTLQQGWSMTKIVLIVTVVMSIFLGALDAFFGWLLQGIILAQNVLFIILSVIVVLALLGAAILIGRSEGA